MIKTSYTSISKLLQVLKYGVRAGDAELANKAAKKLCMIADMSHICIVNEGLSFSELKPLLHECPAKVVNWLADQMDFDSIGPSSASNPAVLFIKVLSKCLEEELRKSSSYNDIEQCTTNALKCYEDTIEDTISMEDEIAQELSKVYDTAFASQFLSSLLYKLLENPCNARSVFVEEVDKALAQAPILDVQTFKNKGASMDRILHYASLPFLMYDKLSNYSVAIVSPDGDMSFVVPSTGKEIVLGILNKGAAMPIIVDQVGSIGTHTASDVSYVKKYEGTDEIPDPWEWFDGLYIDLKDAQSNIYRLVFFVE